MFKGVRAARAKVPSKKEFHPEYECECGQRLKTVTDGNIKSHQHGKNHAAALACKATGQPEKTRQFAIVCMHVCVRVCVCVRARVCVVG